MVRSPKSARHAWPFLSIKMLALIKRRVRRQGDDSHSKPYPFQIPMYHRPTVHVYQPPSDVFELWEPIISDGCVHQSD